MPAYLIAGFFITLPLQIRFMKQLTNTRYLIATLMIAALCFGSTFVNAQTIAKPTAKSTKSAAKSAVLGATAVPAAPKGAMAIVDQFFKKYKEDGTSTAIDYLFGTNKYFSNAAGINLLKTKLDSLRLSTGPFLGKELISQKAAGTSLVFYSFLVKNEIQPMRFTFMFYKPQSEWVLYRFKYDDQMDVELEDAGKINNKH